MLFLVNNNKNNNDDDDYNDYNTVFQGNCSWTMP